MSEDANKPSENVQKVEIDAKTLEFIKSKACIEEVASRDPSY